MCLIIVSTARTDPNDSLVELWYGSSKSNVFSLTKEIYNRPVSHTLKGDRHHVRHDCESRIQRNANHPTTVKLHGNKTPTSSLISSSSRSWGQPPLRVLYDASINSENTAKSFLRQALDAMARRCRLVFDKAVHSNNSNDSTTSLATTKRQWSTAARFLVGNNSNTPW